MKKAIIITVLGILVLLLLFFCFFIPKNIAVYSISFVDANYDTFSVLYVDPQKNLYVNSKNSFGKSGENESVESTYKIMSNVKSVNKELVLQENGTLWRLDFAKDPYMISENVITFHKDYKTDAYDNVSPENFDFLKSDNSLWHYENNTLKKLDDSVIDYSNGVLLKNDGSVLIIGSEKNKLIQNNVKSFYIMRIQGIGEFNPRSEDDNFGKKAILSLLDDKSLWLYNGKISEKLVENVEKVFVADTSFFVIKTDKSLWSYGSNKSGKLGIGNNKSVVNNPAKILENVKNIDYQGEWMFALKEDNSLWTWGSNNLSPTLVSNDIKKIIVDPDRISQDYMKMFFIKNDNSLWKYDNKKQIQKLIENVRDFDFSGIAECAITYDNSLWVRSFYPNDSGVNLNKISDNVESFVDMPNYAFYTKKDGTLWALGNARDFLGNGNALDVTPRQIVLN